MPKVEKRWRHTPELRGMLRNEAAWKSPRLPGDELDSLVDSLQAQMDRTIDIWTSRYLSENPISVGNQFTGELSSLTKRGVKITKIGDPTGNWVEGTYRKLFFEAKIFANPSDYGINRGRVSKLTIYKPDPEEKMSEAMRYENIVTHYERGWHCRPKKGSKEAELVKVLSTGKFGPGEE